MLPAGALYVPGAERLIPSIARVFRWAREQGIPVLSSVDAHAENDPEFRDWPAHCVQGTAGQQKIPCTLLPDRRLVPNREGVELPVNAPQVIVEKQSLDIFSNPNWERFLALHPEEECVVIGVATDYCVRHVVEGLLDRERRVVIVTDSICGIDPQASQQVLDRAVDRGARLLSSTDLGRPSGCAGL